MEISKFLKRIDQDDYDDWIEERRSISELVKKHRFMATMFKGKILNAIEENSPEDFIETFKEHKPEIDIGDHEECKDRIQEELEDIRRLL